MNIAQDWKMFHVVAYDLLAWVSFYLGIAPKEQNGNPGQFTSGK